MPDLTPSGVAWSDNHGNERFTSPTVPRLQYALKELAKEGGVAARHQRYQQISAAGGRNAGAGFTTLLDDETSLAHYHRLIHRKTRSIALANFIAASKSRALLSIQQSVAKRLLPHRQHWRSICRRYHGPADRHSYRHVLMK